MRRGKERGPIRHLEWRVRLFGAGAILAMFGIFGEQPWMVTTAIVVLLAGVALRFVGKDDREGEGEPERD